jgi:hypothetical protein
MPPPSLTSVRQAITDAHANWQAADNPISRLSEIERLRRLGVRLRPGLTLPQLESQIASQVPVHSPVAASTPHTFDYRNVEGANYLTSIKDQLNCGACVAFATAATVETTLAWIKKTPNPSYNLSEAQLFFCYAESAGSNCDIGWWPDGAYHFFANNGVANLASYQYLLPSDHCRGLSPSWRSTAAGIVNAIVLQNSNQMKDWISTKGPVSACLTIYDDFFLYSSGIYKHVTGDIAGAHCVSIIGFDDLNSCWICKNQWGPAWGESGYFQIGYGECGIESIRVHGVDGVCTLPLEHGSLLTAFSNVGSDSQLCRVHFSPDGTALGGRFPLYEGASPVSAMMPYGGGMLVAFRNAGGNGNRIWFSPDENHLGGGELWYDGTSPVTAMIPYGGGILVAFSRAGGNGYRIWFTPDNGQRPLHLGGGELWYDGSSPVTAMIAYGGGILAAFSDAGGNGYRIWFTPDSGHLHLGGGQHWYDGSSPVTAMIAYGGGILVAFRNAGGNGNRIWFTPDDGERPLHLGGGQLWYDGSAPVTAMIAYGGGILVSFSHADGYGNRVWFTLDDGKRPLHLGGGELRYDGVSPVTAISLF